MDYQKLRTEIEAGISRNDIQAGDSDAVIAAWASTLTEVRSRTVINAHEIFEAIELADFPAAGSVNAERLAMILSMGTVDISGLNTRALLTSMFASASTTTKNALKALETETVSMFGTVRVSDVTKARAL